MAALQQTWSGDASTAIAGKIGETMRSVYNAREEASGMKNLAEEFGKEMGIDPMLRKGEFFTRSLMSRATAGLPRFMQRQMPSWSAQDPSYFARGQSSPSGYGGSTPVSFPPPSAAWKAKFAGQPFPNVAAGSPLTNQVRPQTPIANTPSTTSTKREPAVKVKDEKLGNFLSAVSQSLSATVSSMNKKLDETEAGLIQVKDGMTNIHKQLEVSGDSLEEKLDAIIQALREQNSFDFRNKKEVDSRLEQQDIEQKQFDAGTELIQRQMETDDEFERRQSLDDEEERARKLMMMQDKTDQPGMDIPNPWDDAEEMERGGIISGPDSGYPVILHGDEAVIPLDNNFTQGEPSAVDGSRTNPQSSVINNYEQIDQKFEKGAPSMQKFGGNFFNNVAKVDKKEEVNASSRITDIMMKPITTIGSTIKGLLEQSFQNTDIAQSDFYNNLIGSISSLFNIKDVVNNRTGTSSGRSSGLKSVHQRGSGRFGVGGAPSLKSQAGSGGHTAYGKGGAPALSSSSQVVNNSQNFLSNWWNKGRNVRVPNESTASWKNLMADDAKQLTRSNKAFKQGAKGIKGWRPLKAFTPKMLTTGPTPAVRQAIERPIRGLIGGSKVAGRGIAGGVGGFIMDMIFPEPINTYDEMTGPNAFYNNPSLTEEQRNFYIQQFQPSAGGNGDMQIHSADQSRSNALSKMDQMVSASQPVVINKLSEVDTTEDMALEHIANTGDPGLDQFYPSPY